MASDYRKTDLFGGAITANLPSGFADVSTIRQVPDHQEVFLAANGFASIIFDITERISNLSTDEEALELHLDDVIDPGDEKQIWQPSAVQPEHFSSSTPALTLVATTKPPAPPISPTVPTSTTILMTLIRLVSQSTDLVITMNLPHIPAETSTENGVGASGTSLGGNQDSLDANGGRLGSSVEEGIVVRDEVLKTLQIHDWGLFEAEDDQ